MLTVTVATYNVEKFIYESIDSILQQTYKNFELICIDDGSSDNTVKILKEFAAKDNRVTVIVKSKNEGLAVARNESLALAKGKYVVFFDGDDLYDVSLFEKAVNIAEKNNSDLVIWDYMSFYETSEITKDKLSLTLELQSLSTNDVIGLLRRPAFTWVKMLKTEAAKSLNIHFPKGLTRQDIPVHWHLLTQLNKISLLPEKLSFYRQQPEATTAKKDKKLFHLAYVMDIVKDYLVDNQIYDKYKNEFLRQQLNLLFGMYDSVKEEYKTEALSIIKERLTDDHYSFIKQNNAIRKQAKYFYLSLTGNPLFKIKYQVWLTVRAIYRKIKS